jgi:hypothetical protein
MDKRRSKSIRPQGAFLEMGLIGLMLAIGAVWARQQVTMSRDAELACFVGFAACLGGALGCVFRRPAFGAFCATSALGVVLYNVGLSRLLLALLSGAFGSSN